MGSPEVEAVNALQSLWERHSCKQRLTSWLCDTFQYHGMLCM